MRFLHDNHRKFEFTHLIYLEGVAEIKSETTKEGVESWKLPEITFKPLDAEGKPITAEKVWNPIHKIYNPGENIGEQRKSPYYKMIKKYINETFPESKKSDKETWLNNSIVPFRAIYLNTQKSFFVKTNNLQERLENHLTIIENKTKSDLSNLKQIIDKKKKTIDVSNQEESAVESANLSNAPAIRQEFASYLKLQNDYYLNENFQKQRLSNVKPIAKSKLIRRYNDNAEKFKTAIEKRTMAKLNYLLNQKSTTPDTISKYKELIKAEYKYFASIDKNTAFIDIEDFMAMEKYSNVNFNLINSVQKSSKRQDHLYMESMYIMKYEVWEKTTETARRMLVMDCYSNGTEAAFITKVNKYRERSKQKPVATFGEAKLHFKALMDERTKMGVTATYNLLNDFKTTAYGERLKKIKKVKPDSLQLLVLREREFLISQRLTPQAEHDKLIVEFMSTSRKGRDSILKHKRAELFKAIKNIKHHYPKYIKDNFSSISKKPGELRYQPNLSKRPTRDDKAARIYALLTLACEAEGIIENFSTTDKYKGHNLEDQLKKIQNDKNTPLMGLQFEDVLRSKASPYASELSRGGWNGRDMGIKFLKVLGVVTFMANVANSIKSSEGKDPFERAVNAMGNIATNPGVYVGAGLAGGAHLVEMKPRYLDYPLASAHEKFDIHTNGKLTGIRKKVGPKHINTFMQRGDPLDNNSPLSKEWLIMDNINSKKIEKLVDKARKKPSKIGPIIENKDIEKLIPKNQRQTVLSGISRTKENARTRFLFYEKFLYGQKPNIQQLRNVITD